MASYRVAQGAQAAALLARLGERAAQYQDRYGLVIGDLLVSHGAATRDFVCSCGSPLVTRWIEGGGWQTICAAEPGHPQSGFLTKSAYAYREHRRLQALEEG